MTSGAYIELVFSLICFVGSYRRSHQTWLIPINLPPARIFLGEAGSQVIGFLLAWFTVKGVPQNPHPSDFAAMLFVVGVPLFELTFLIAIRIRKGVPVWRGSSDHLALRLQAAGLSKWQTDLIVWSFGIALCTVAWSLLQALPATVHLAIIGTSLCLLGLCWRLLLRWEVNFPTRLSRLSRAR